MPRNMSFSLTTEQIRNRTKTVTRRKGWEFLKAGDVVNACVKCMGLKPGESIERLCQIRIVDVRREPLHWIERPPDFGMAECEREGFPGMTGMQFVDMFCEHMDCHPADEITRIEFEYV
mgnify:CR=1 FL=1